MTNTIIRQSPGGPSERLRRGFLGLCATVLLGSLPTMVVAGSGVGGRGAVLPIRGMIDDIMRDSVERRIQAARDAGATVLIFELDTPGGLVTSALDICRQIKGLPPDIRTVAWVHHHAYSAGAMIAVACQEIWMSPSSAIGDCAPIMVVPMGGVQELGPAERAKVESPILQEFRDSAARNGYNPLLSRAMVAVGEEVWWLENVADPTERRFVSGDDKKKLVDDIEPDKREWRLVENYTLPEIGRTISVSQPVDRPDELLTMSQYDAVAYGFARGIAADLDDLAGRLELSGPPTLFAQSGWEKFAAWLNSPVVRGILLVIVLIGAYMEFQSPGLILPGATALVALAIFLAAPYAAGLASIWTIVILVVGLILLSIEVFLIPGFGIVGLLGIALILVGLLATFVPTDPALPTFSAPSLSNMWRGAVTGLKVLVSSVIASMIGIVLLVRYLPQSRIATGVITDSPPPEAVLPPEPYGGLIQVGAVGIVTADLRPGGQARFGSEIVDVHSQTGYVERGTKVQVVRRDGLEIVVRPLTGEQGNT